MNPSKPPKGAALAAVADLPELSALRLDFAEGEARFSLILVRSGGRIAAFENRCPHARFPLEKPDGGVILQDGAFLICAAHGASFRVADGSWCGGPGQGQGLTSIAVAVSGGIVVMNE